MKHASEWSAGTSEAWANESHRVAVELAYKAVPADGPPPSLDEVYIDRAGAAIDEQLQGAGVRLAAILNRALSGARDDEHGQAR